VAAAEEVVSCRLAGAVGDVDDDVPRSQPAATARQIATVATTTVRRGPGCSAIARR
jgi:hypothetical protein